MVVWAVLLIYLNIKIDMIYVDEALGLVSDLTLTTLVMFYKHLN